MSAPVLIIGPGGIGGALAHLLHRQGKPLALIGRTESSLTTLQQETGAAVALADVTDTSALKNAISNLGTNGFSGLAYCVGSITLKPLSRAEPEDFLTAFSLNAVAASQAVRFALPALAAGSGIVLFSTIAVAQGFSNHTVVSAAKGAVEGLTRALAAELAPKLRVNCVAPSLTETPLARSLTGNEQMARAIAVSHAIPRLGQAADSAEAAAFLLDGDKSGWMSGQILAVDGGRSRLRTKG